MSLGPAKDCQIGYTLVKVHVDKLKIWLEWHFPKMIARISNDNIKLWETWHWVRADERPELRKMDPLHNAWTCWQPLIIPPINEKRTRVSHYALPFPGSPFNSIPWLPPQLPCTPVPSIFPSSCFQDSTMCALTIMDLRVRAGLHHGPWKKMAFFHGSIS